MVEGAPSQAEGNPDPVVQVHGIPNQANAVNRKKRFNQSAIILAVVFAIAAAGGWALVRQDKPKQTGLYSGPIDKVNIANIGEYSIFNLIAKDKGYFTANGLDAKITEYASGPPAMAALLAGTEDISVGAADFVAVVNIFSHPDIRILSQVSSQQVFQVIARKDKGINSPAGLAGKKIAVTKGSAGEFSLARFLTLNNLDVSNVQVINLPPADIVSQLEQGTIDAAVTFEPHIYDLNKNLDGKVMIWPALGDQRTFALAYSLDSFVKDNPSTIQRFLNALAQAESYANAHPQDSKALVAADLHYDKAYVDYVWPKFDFSLGLNQEMLLTMEDQARWVIDQKATNNTTIPNYLNNIYFAGLEKVEPGSVNIIH